MTDTNFIPLNTDLINMGGTATCSPNCGVCTGDCDGDVDCAGDLKCFQRQSSTSQVPGCFIGGDGDVGTYDYCYDPSVLSESEYDYDKMTVGNNGTLPCNSYCSTGWNNEAPKGSTCLKAVNTNTEEVTGCDMTNGTSGLTCYCKNPSEYLNYNDEISLLNLAAPTNPNFLWSCGATPSETCGRSVATFTNNVGDYIYANDEGKWRILDSQGNTSTAQLNYGDTIMLQNTIDNFILETCGQSDCNNGHELYSVSTHATVTSNSVQRWKIVSSTGATGAVRNGDDIKLLNLAGYTSYLNTCGVKTGGCGKGQLYGVNTCKLGSYDASHITSEWRISTKRPKELHSEELDTYFTRFVDKKLPGFDLITLTDKTLDECKSSCRSDNGQGGYCHSFEYDKQNSVCNISHDTAGKHGAPELSSGVGWDYYERDRDKSYYKVPIPAPNWWRGTLDKPYGNLTSWGICDRNKGGVECHGDAICDPNSTQDDLTSAVRWMGTFGIMAEEDISEGYGINGTCELQYDKWDPSNFAHDRGGPDKDGCTIQPMGACNHSGSLESGDDGCCKDYTAEGGENYFCRDSGKLFSTDYRCRKPEEE